MMTDHLPKEALVDKGYRGIDAPELSSGVAARSVV